MICPQLQSFSTAMRPWSTLIPGTRGSRSEDRWKGKAIGFRVAKRPGKRRALTDTPEGRLDDLVEAAKAHIRAKGEHPFRVIKRQFGSQKTRLRGMLKNRCMVNVLAALANLFMVRQLLLCKMWIWERCSYLGQNWLRFLLNSGVIWPYDTWCARKIVHRKQIEVQALLCGSVAQSFPSSLLGEKMRSEAYSPPCLLN